MASRRRFGNVEVALSNLDKVLYPATGTTKGAVVDYLTTIAPALLPHIADRPVTRKRWPNGVDEPSFFEKNLAAHAPRWIRRQTIEHSDRRVTYPVFDSVAGLAWLGQQAALEIHVPQWRFSGDDRGRVTRLVFDLDPGPGVGLDECAQVAVWIRDTVRATGLDAYPVTSGSKGLHIYVPLDRELSPGGASTVAKEVASGLEARHPDLITATMAKSARPGKVFVDWSQNNPSKTTIAPYSLRGRAHPTVAAPREWDEIENREHLRHIGFEEMLQRWRDHGDLLAGLDPPDSQSNDRLTTYRSKRNATRTPEPVPSTPTTATTDAPAAPAGNRFVIQEHHARRLHWDLRLERDDVLASWAVPKGPPASPNENRLAVHTEDHPLEYLDFHGTIPGGEYGAGEMTIWDSGTYETEKWRDDEIIVRLRGSRLNGRYALIRTDGKHWLLHLMKPENEPASTAAQPLAGHAPKRPAPLPRGLAPMLATAGDVAALDGDAWTFETKWDGFRVLVEIADGTVTVRSRAGNTVTPRYPRLAALGRELAGHAVVLDGEAVVFDAQGAANLALLQAHPASAVFVAFDVLYLDGVSLVRKRHSDRRQVLQALAERAPALLVPPQLEGPGASALRDSRDHGSEGVVAKRKDSTYLPGRRGQSWVKTRNWRTEQVVIGGWRHSTARPFASLLVGVRHEGRLIYVGRVGTGFGERTMADLATRLHRLERDTSPFDNDLTPDERKDARWATPTLTGTVRYMNWTDSGRMWHPAWISPQPAAAQPDQ